MPPRTLSPSGTPLAYGWDAEGRVIEREAAQLRESARRIVAGESSFSGEARRLTAAGEGTWYPATVSRALLHPRVVGDRAAVRGRRPAAILDRAVYDALSAAAEERHRASSGRPSSGTLAGLLAGLVVCGRCGAPLRLAGPRDNRVYRCPRARRLPGGELSCGRTQITARHIEAHVTERALADWAADSAPYRAAGPPGVRAYDEELAALATAAGHLEDQHAAGLLRSEEYRTLSARYARVRADLEARAARAADAGLPAAEGEAIRGWWERAGEAQRRALLGAVYPVIRVRPAARPGQGRGGDAIDTARVEPEHAPVPVG